MKILSFFTLFNPHSYTFGLLWNRKWNILKNFDSSKQKFIVTTKFHKLIANIFYESIN